MLSTEELEARGITSNDLAFYLRHRARNREYLCEKLARDDLVPLQRAAILEHLGPGKRS
jgi:hypothetical protein